MPSTTETQAHPAINRRLEQMPSSYRNQYKKAMRGHSPTTAIAAFCRECVAWDHAPDQIRHCTDPGCPLFPYGPYRGSK